MSNIIMYVSHDDRQFLAQRKLVKFRDEDSELELPKAWVRVDYRGGAVDSLCRDKLIG